MKKEDLRSFAVYAVMLVLVLLFGLLFLNRREVDSVILMHAGQGAYIGFLIGAAITGVVVNALMFELAHLIGAKVGRYQVLSFNVLYFCFYRQDDKLKFGFKNFDGLTGETKIVPKKDAKKTPNPTTYLLLGWLFFLIEVVVVVTLFYMFTTGQNIDPTKADIGYFLIIVGFVGFLIFLYNVAPFKLDCPTDGYRLTLVSNPKNRVAFNELLRVEHEIAIGNKDVEVMTFDEITNFTADLNLNKVYLLLNDAKYDEAEVLINQIINSKKSISNSVYVDAISQLIFIKFMTLSLEEATKFVEETVDPDFKREISKGSTMVSSRAYILIEGLIDKSKHECIATISNIQKAFKKVTKNRQAIEIKLYNIVIDKIIENHSNWKFEQYRLIATTDAKSNTKVELKALTEDEEEAPAKEAEEISEEPKVETEKATEETKDKE